MRSLAGVYDTYELAEVAVKRLKEEGFTPNHISLVGLAEMKDDKLHLKQQDNLLKVGVGATVAIESVIGILAGVSIIAIPGLGFLYGAGAIVGAFAGLDFGIITGGIIAILAKTGIKEDIGHVYGKLIQEGKYLVLVNGDEAEVKKAYDILHKEGTHSGLHLHEPLEK